MAADFSFTKKVADAIDTDKLPSEMPLGDLEPVAHFNSAMPTGVRLCLTTTDAFLSPLQNRPMMFILLSLKSKEMDRQSYINMQHLIKPTNKIHLHQWFQFNL